MSDPSFWENGDHAKEISQKATEAKAAYDTYTRLFARAESIKELTRTWKVNWKKRSMS